MHVCVFAFVCCAVRPMGCAVINQPNGKRRAEERRHEEERGEAGALMWLTRCSGMAPSVSQQANL